MTERRTFLAWFEYLDAKGRELTISEFMALLLAQGREYARVTMEQAKEQREAAEHLEGMIGTLDEWLATGNAHYRQIADRRARPAPMLPEREAT